MLSREQGVELAQSLVDFDVQSAEPFGAGKFSDVFLITSDRGQYVLRVAPPDDLRQLFYEYRMMRQEPALHAILRRETDAPVPEILSHDFSHEHIDRDFLIMPRLSGNPLSEVPLSHEEQSRTLYQLGQYVRQIHAITDSQNRFGYLGAHAPMTPQNTWQEAFERMYRKLLDDIASTQVYDADTADEAMSLLQDHLSIFGNCEKSHLCHGDLWVANFLVGPSGTLTGLLDFDRACWGDPEWDLAIADYCGITHPAFWDGYGCEMDRSSKKAAIRRFFYLLYEHQKYIVISISARRNDPRGADRYAQQSLQAMERFRKTGKPTF